jgi:elongation factor P
MAKKMSGFKRGQGLQWRNDVWIIQDMQHVKPGKGPAYLQTEMKNPKTGQIVNNRFRPEETLEPVHFEHRTMEYLYSDGNSHVFMDTESYEQVELPKSYIGDKDVFLTPNIEVDICDAEGEIISAEIPNTVDLVVTDVPPQVKGATVTNQQKDAICEGGAKVRVPPFVENGTIIKVDTRTGEYLGRV